MLPQIDFLQHSNTNRFFLMAGPCAAESEEIVMHIAERIVNITNRLQIPYIFKASYRKANRACCHRHSCCRRGCFGCRIC